MKDEVVQFVFIVMVVVFAAAMEELLPTVAGIGLPILLASVLVMAPRTKVLPGVMLAIGAGAFEDALSGLQPVTSISFFVIAVLLARKDPFRRLSLWLFFPAFGLWVGLCSPGPMGDVFARMMLLIPLGAAAYALTWWLTRWFGRKAGLDE